MFFLPAFAYAEIHYRFKYFISFIKRNEPEIIADAPHRLNPDAKLPILILVKDADIYPITINNFIVTIKKNGKKLSVHSFKNLGGIPVFAHFWWNVLEISFHNELLNLFGMFEVDVEIEFERNGSRKTISNNNLPTSSKSSLKIFRSETPLPAFRAMYHGDTHTHSNYTEDQVEFGSPINASVVLSKAMGLSFFCVCDHSYDLDDRLDSYLLNDAALPKWNLFQKDVDEINLSQNDVVVIRGEEVTVRNAKGRNVHFLLWGTRTFFYGSGDGAEKWFRLRSENSISDILRSKPENTVAFASHPTERVPFLHRLFFGRDSWSLNDMRNDGLHGLQILNGENNKTFFNGISVWKKLLLEGKRIFIAAGNDAHGNFNRSIQLYIPFLSIAEKETQIFGAMRSSVFCETLDEASILESLRSGKCIVNNGPIVNVEIENENHYSAKLGETISAKKIVVKLQGISTAEFGEFDSIKIYCGIIGKNEFVIEERAVETAVFDFHFLTQWQTITSFSYIRVEAFTKNGIGHDAHGFCYTNPIWILPE